jgi:polysaccharide biosynthesis/export protein
MDADHHSLHRLNGARVRGAALLLFALIVYSDTVRAQTSNYIVGAQDVLAITLFDQQDLSGKYTVETDGTFTFPLIGRVTVGGLTMREVEQALRAELSKGFFKNPQVSVAVEQYRSQRVFVMGEVRTPGPYPLVGNMTLIEALARAGSTTEYAAGEALIVRSRDERASGGPVLPEQDSSASVIHVDVKALQMGRLSENAELRDGDTIFVPRAELVYVFGQVNRPGSYTLQRNTTVLQALSLAGGVTDRGTTGRIRIARVVEGKKVEVRVKVEDVVLAGDTIIVPERFF